jgi:hypothetical protein
LIESFLLENFILFSLSLDEDEEDDLVPDMIGLEGASLPPDRTTFLPLPLATKVAQVIPPYRSVSHFILLWQFFSVLFAFSKFIHTFFMIFCCTWPPFAFT